MENLNALIDSYDLRDDIRFLGFIPREEQLMIMKGARAIIQPSFFEGWSTVVEDAKAVNSFIVLSNLEVHKEQIQRNYNANNFW